MERLRSLRKTLAAESAVRKGDGGWYLQAMMALGRPGTQMLPKMGGEIIELAPTQMNKVAVYILDRK